MWSQINFLIFERKFGLYFQLFFALVWHQHRSKIADLVRRQRKVKWHPARGKSAINNCICDRVYVCLSSKNWFKLTISITLLSPLKTCAPSSLQFSQLPLIVDIAFAECKEWRIHLTVTESIPYASPSRQLPISHSGQLLSILSVILLHWGLRSVRFGVFFFLSFFLGFFFKISNGLWPLCLPRVVCV